MKREEFIEELKNNAKCEFTVKVTEDGHILANSGCVFYRFYKGDDTFDISKMAVYDSGEITVLNEGLIRYTDGVGMYFDDAIEIFRICEAVNKEFDGDMLSLYLLLGYVYMLGVDGVRTFPIEETEDKPYFYIQQGKAYNHPF